MRTYLDRFCRFAPYVALGLVGILGGLDPALISVMAVILIVTTDGRRCLARRSA